MPSLLQKPGHDDAWLAALWHGCATPAEAMGKPRFVNNNARKKSENAELCADCRELLIFPVAACRKIVDKEA